MRIAFRKEQGRSVSIKKNLKDYRGTLILDNGINVFISPDKLKITNVDIDNLEPIAHFTHLKSSAITKRKKVFEETTVLHRIYSIEILGIPMLFERINDETTLRTYNPQESHGINELLPKDAYTFVKYAIADNDNLLCRTLSADTETSLRLSKPKRSGNIVTIKVARLPVEFHMTVRSRGK